MSTARCASSERTKDTHEHKSQSRKTPDRARQKAILCCTHGAHDAHQPIIIERKPVQSIIGSTLNLRYCFYGEYSSLAKLLTADVATLDYVVLCQNLPLYEDTLHTQCTRKWAPPPYPPQCLPEPASLVFSMRCWAR